MESSFCHATRLLIVNRDSVGSAGRGLSTFEYGVADDTFLTRFRKSCDLDSSRGTRIAWQRNVALRPTP